jgi:hypothetical protein
MTLAPAEFMRRFLLHVLPTGFHRIRHYGLLANVGRRENLARARHLLNTSPPEPVMNQAAVTPVPYANAAAPPCVLLKSSCAGNQSAHRHDVPPEVSSRSAQLGIRIAGAADSLLLLVAISPEFAAPRTGNRPCA